MGSICLGEVFDRPYPERLYAPGEPGADLWAAAEETRHDIIGRYRKVIDHAGATIAAIDFTSASTTLRGDAQGVARCQFVLHTMEVQRRRRVTEARDHDRIGRGRD